MKYKFFSRTIMKSIEDILRKHFVPSITSGSSISEHLRQLIALPMRLGGMAISIPHLNTDTECNTSRLLTADFVDHITSKNTESQSNKERISEVKSNIKKRRAKAENRNFSKMKENMSKDYMRVNDILQQPVCTNWLNIILTEQFNYNLNKQQFLDAVRLRYQLSLPNLSTRCHHVLVFLCH